MFLQSKPCIAKLAGVAFLVVLLGSGLTTGRAPDAQDESAGKRLARGKRLYNGAGACVACHGTDGRPTVPDAPDLTDADWQRQRTDEELSKSIANGKGTMPAFKGSPADIEALVAYVRSLAK